MVSVSAQGMYSDIKKEIYHADLLQMLYKLTVSQCL